MRPKRLALLWLFCASSVPFLGTFDQTNKEQKGTLHFLGFISSRAVVDLLDGATQTWGDRPRWTGQYGCSRSRSDMNAEQKSRLAALQSALLAMREKRRRAEMATELDTAITE